jgi:hypothetical protein
MLKFIKGGVLWLSLSSIVFLVACGGGGSNANVSLPGGGSGGSGITYSSNNFGGAGSGGPVFGSFFGMNQIHLSPCDTTPFAGPFTDAPIAAFRAWDTCHIQWPDLEPTQGNFTFTNLDTVMSAASAAGVNDVIMEVGRIPNWVSSAPNDPDCDAANTQANGECDPPIDIDAVPGSGLGDGTDASFIAYAQALLTHAVANNYPLKYLEIFEEFHRSDTLGGTTMCVPPKSNVTGFTACSWRGTYAQMLRMTQDLRCIAKGIASDPITATGLTCGTAGYGAPGTGIGIMPSLNVSVGNAGPSPDFDNGAVVMANYLYCNQNPPASSVCNYGSVPGNPASAATDMIGGHAYFQTVLPENVLSWIATQHSLLSTADQSKPYFIGEGSWNQNSNVPDTGLEAAYIVRWYLSLWMTKDVQRGYWWSWDISGEDGDAGLWSAASQTFGDCITPDPNASGGFYCADGVAFNQMVGWLRNATAVSWSCPDTTCTNQTPGVYTFTITGNNGYEGMVAWDSTAISSCPTVPCGSTAVPTLPGLTVSQWRDLTGTTHTGAPSAIGASPIIIENMVPPS